MNIGVEVQLDSWVRNHRAKKNKHHSTNVQKRDDNKAARFIHRLQRVKAGPSSSQIQEASLRT